MKKVRIVAVGRLKEPFFKSAAAEYEKRLSAYCALSIVEIEEAKGGNALKTEAESIESKVAGALVLLDSRGEQLTSPEFAAMLDKLYLGYPEVTFVIGGSEGVDDALRRRADKTVAFGRLTYPHRLMRVMLLEQVYRAFTITANTPYHK